MVGYVVEDLWVLKLDAVLDQPHDLGGTPADTAVHLEQVGFNALPIVGLISFAVLQGKTQRLSDDINEASVSVLNLIVTNRDKLDLSTLGAARED